MSRFVSAGTTEEPPERSKEWLEAQKEIDKARQQKQGDGKQDNSKSLYEVLQANKAAKQEAFEESARLKNQFRSLDEDEVEFLDSVLESTRANDAAIQKDTLEQLEIFRKQRETADKSPLGEDENVDETTQWTFSGKKRKKANEKEVLKGVKLRKSSSAADRVDVDAKTTNHSVDTSSQQHVSKAEELHKLPTKSQPSGHSPPDVLLPETAKNGSRNDKKEVVAQQKSVLGLSAYSSDSE